MDLDGQRMRDKIYAIEKEQMEGVWLVAGKDGIDGFIDQATDQILELIRQVRQQVAKEIFEELYKTCPHWGDIPKRACPVCMDELKDRYLEGK